MTQRARIHLRNNPVFDPPFPAVLAHATVMVVGRAVTTAVKGERAESSSRAPY